MYEKFNVSSQGCGEYRYFLNKRNSFHGVVVEVKRARFYIFIGFENPMQIRGMLLTSCD